MKLKLYLDTSVFSAYLDDRALDRRAQTMEFWQRLPAFDACTSVLAREELERTPNADRRKRLLRLLDGLTVHPLTLEMRRLSERYVQAGVFTAVMTNDAAHVAAAVLTRQDMLLSWNFKHLVNRVRRAKINQVNVSQGLPTIEIIAPPEI
jgi:predicted nucleic acid-binding protein